MRNPAMHRAVLAPAWEPGEPQGGLPQAGRSLLVIRVICEIAMQWWCVRVETLHVGERRLLIETCMCTLQLPRVKSEAIACSTGLAKQARRAHQGQQHGSVRGVWTGQSGACARHWCLHIDRAPGAAVPGAVAAGCQAPTPCALRLSVCGLAVRSAGTTECAF